MAHKPRSLHRTMLRGVDGRALPFRLRSAVLRVLRARPARRRARQSPGGREAVSRVLIGGRDTALLPRSSCARATCILDELSTAARPSTA